MSDRPASTASRAASSHDRAISAWLSVPNAKQSLDLFERGQVIFPNHPSSRANGTPSLHSVGQQRAEECLFHSESALHVALNKCIVFECLPSTNWGRR